MSGSLKRSEQIKSISIFDGLKLEDCDQVLSDDQFSEKYGLLKYNEDNNHEEQLNAIKSLVSSSSSQHQTPSIKSKKEALKEKRDKKKLQIMTKNRFEDIPFDNNSEKTVDDKTAKQKIKNRESAQLSRDRKKQQDTQIQQDILILTEENKLLQQAILQSYTCQQCGYFNNPADAMEQMQLKQQQEQLQQHEPFESQLQRLDQFQTLGHSSIPCGISLEEYNYSPNIAREQYHSLNTNPQTSSRSSAPLPVYNNSASANDSADHSAADYTRANPAASSYAPFNFNFAKGMWSMALVVFVLYTILIFSGGTSDQPASLDTAFRQLHVGDGSYDQIIQNCKNMSKEELLECLLRQVQALQEAEQEKYNKKTNLQSGNTRDAGDDKSREVERQIEADKHKIGTEIAEYQETNARAESISSKPADLVDEAAAAVDLEAISSANSQSPSSYAQLSSKLDEMHNEKLHQIELLKKTYLKDLFQTQQEQPHDILSIDVADKDSLDIGFDVMKDNQNGSEEEESDQRFLSGERTNLSLFQSTRGVEQEGDDNHGDAIQEIQESGVQNNAQSIYDLSQEQAQEGQQHHMNENDADDHGFIENQSDQQPFNEVDDDEDNLSRILSSSQYVMQSIGEQPFNDKENLLRDMIPEFASEESSDALRKKAQEFDRKIDMSNSINEHYQESEDYGEGRFLRNEIHEQEKLEIIKQKQRNNLNEQELAEIEEEEQVRQSDIIIPNITQFFNDTISSMDEEEEQKEYTSSNENTDNSDTFTFPVVAANPINYHKIIQNLPSSASAATMQEKTLSLNQPRTSHISCQYSFDSFPSNSTETSISVAGYQNGNPQNFKILFAPQFPTLSEQLAQQHDQHLSFQCQFLEPTICQETNDNI